jgi:hypothetical protein
MGHSERSEEDLYQNIPDITWQDILFRGAVEYFI